MWFLSGGASGAVHCLWSWLTICQQYNVPTLTLTKTQLKIKCTVNPSCCCQLSHVLQHVTLLQSWFSTHNIPMFCACPHANMEPVNVAGNTMVLTWEYCMLWLQSSYCTFKCYSFIKAEWFHCIKQRLFKHFPPLFLNM